MMQIIEIHKGYKPLSLLKGQLICYSRGQLWILKNSQFKPLMKLHTSDWKDCTRLTSRFFRREPKLAVVTLDNRLLVASQKKLLLVDTENEQTRVIASSREGFSDPLNICTNCMPWLAVWGDYGSNPKGTEINVYGLKQNLTVEILYTYPSRTIRHIHNIVPRLHGGYYILTGDLESTSGIYIADSTFCRVEGFKLGNQQYRAVVAFDTKNGLLYATDSVNEPNHIYLLQEDGDLLTVGTLNGSCIYGTAISSDYFFSTTVEPDESKHGIMSWISNKRGKGILSNQVTLVKVDSALKAKEVLRLDKDRLPMKLMQYGSIQFPFGLSEEIWIYPTAVKKYDGATIRLEARS